MAFTLGSVLELGGQKEDFKALQKVDEDEDSDLETEMDEDADRTSHVDDSEIERFIWKLGLSKTIPRDERDDTVTSSKKKSNKKTGNKTAAVKKDVEKPKDPCQLKLRHDDYGIETKAEKEPKLKQPALKQLLDAKVLGELQISASKPIKRMLVSPGGQWFDNIPDFPSDDSMELPDAQVIAACEKIGAMLLERDSKMYKQKKESQKGGDAQWLRTVLTSGTLSDRLAALALQIQESPVHQLGCLDTLVRMIKKKSKREALMAVDTIKQLWLTDLLPDDRRLKPLAKRPLSYLSTVTQLSGTEARDRLLLFWYFETELHERCGQVVGVLQVLSQDVEENVRKKTAGILYDLLASKPEQEQELLSMLVNKLGDPTRQVSSKAAYLLLKLLSNHPNMKLVVVREVEKLLYRPNVSDKAQYYAVCFLNQLILSQRESQLASRLIDIYFSFFKLYTKKRSVETRMFGALLCGVNRAFPFAKIENDMVFQEHLDTLFQVVHVGTFNTSIQALMLLYQVMESRQSVSDRFYQALYEKLLDPGLRTSSKHAMFLNVLFKALRADPSAKRVMAFIKRLLQVCFYQRADFSCAVLYLISEVEHIRPTLLDKMLMQTEDAEDEEHFKDVSDDENGTISKLSTSVQRQYQPRHRNPLYAGAELTSLWGLQKMTCHFHPSVSRFSNDLLKTSAVEYESNPLQDFTLIRFLDRFVYKNPKKKANDHGGSLMQPKMTSVRLTDKPVNSKQFLSQAERNVREDELFFYKYFTSTARHHKVTEDKSGSDIEVFESFNVYDPEVASVDFAEALRKSKTDQGQQSRPPEDSESSDNESELGNRDHGQDDWSDVDELSEDAMTDKDYEELLLKNMSSEEEDNEMDQTPLQHHSLKGHKSNNDLTEDEGADSIFASAEEFAHLLEENQSVTAGSSGAVKAKPGESLKQLEWERKSSSNWKWQKQRQKRSRSDSGHLQRGRSKRPKTSRLTKGKPVKGKSKVRRKGVRK